MDLPHVYCLSIHADYACRHSGACCTAEWPIPIDPALHHHLRAAFDEGRLSASIRDPFVIATPDDAVRLARTAAGACAFHTATGAPGCAIHARLGEASLPPSCRHFPRVVLLDGRGVHVTLSHFCPTAASMLFRDDVPLEIVDNPPAFPRDREYEGLDARAVLPPLLRPSLLWDFAGYTSWERCAVALLAEPVGPEHAIELLREAATRVEEWSPRRGHLSDAVRRAFESLPPERQGSPRWRTWAPVVNRYLAAKLFASWIPYQSERLMALVDALESAHGALVSEARHATDKWRKPLDRMRLLEAIRRVDLRLIHRVPR